MTEEPRLQARRRRAKLPLPRTEVEYLILADAVEAHNGKLYLMGGGWDTIQIANFEVPASIALACGVVVPYGETDDEHRVAITLQDADGQSVGVDITIGFKTGRAPTLPKGADSHRPFAIQASAKIPGPGTYTFVATIDADPARVRRLQFHALSK